MSASAIGPLIQFAPASPRSATDAPAGGRAALAAWHAGWAVSAALLALVGHWLGAMDGAVFYGVIAMIVPGVAGLGLLWRDEADQRMALLCVWAAAAFVAAGLSGGLTGPLAGFVFLPLAAGMAFGGARPVQIGALGVAFAAVAGLVAGWAASIAARLASCHGGSFSDAPSCDSGSSTVKPGAMVATSISTPPGSRK